MTRIAKYLLLTLFLSGLYTAAARATTHAAATCNESDVAAAAALAGSGDTVAIPAGTCTWTTSFSWNAPSNVILQGAGSQSALGGGDVTVINDSINRSSTDPAAWNINTNASGTFRMTGITFGWGGGAVTYSGSIRITGSSQAFRMDHCHVNKINAVAMDVNGQIYGVLDHNIFDMSPNTSNNGVRIEAANWGGGSNDFGNGSWADATTLGSNRFIFAEDNTFNNGFANDCTQGGRWVFRHNTMNNTSVQTHPTGGGEIHRGCRATELYSNAWNGTSGDFESFDVDFLSSGVAVVWGNNAGNQYQNFISMHSMRRDNSTYAQSPTPSGWGYCGTSFDGTGSVWDQNSNASTGYACLDQPGRGKGDQLNNLDFPNTLNSVTGTIAWPHQALEPTYEWLDTWAGSGGGQFLANYEADVEVQNQDFYLGTGSFNGASGVGTGTLSSRPATCTPMVAYWATDQSTLYQCSSTNTWTAYYTPYTYPHPLVSGQSSGGPAAPTNLAVVVQ